MQCIVKKTALNKVLKAVQIIPYGFLKASDDADTGGEHNIWELLKVFWPEEEVDTWRDALKIEYLLDIVSNLVHMTSDVQDAWNACLFALRPVSISEDGRKSPLNFVGLNMEIYGCNVWKIQA